MQAKLTKTQVVFGKQVTAITPSPDCSIMLTTADPKAPTLGPFSHVISTIPVPVLRTVDLSACKLSNFQTNALREKDNDGAPITIVGGQSFTDRIVRTVVYPSYGPGTGVGPDTGDAVLIASYCWTDDASRLESAHCGQ